MHSPDDSSTRTGGVIHKFTVRPLAGADEGPSSPLASATGLADLVVWRDYYVELDADLTAEQIAMVCDALGDGVVEECVHAQPLRPIGMVQVAHRRGVVDNENDSILTLLSLLGIDARAGKMART